HQVRQAHRQSALGALHAERALADLGSDPARDRHRPFADAAHQNTSASTSPPTFSARASTSESTPRGVETMVMPRPLRTVGSSRLPEYTRRPGFETRATCLIAGSPSKYFSSIRSALCLPVVSSL